METSEYQTLKNFSWRMGAGSWVHCDNASTIWTVIQLHAAYSLYWHHTVKKINPYMFTKVIRTQHSAHFAYCVTSIHRMNAYWSRFSSFISPLHPLSFILNVFIWVPDWMHRCIWQNTKKYCKIVLAIWGILLCCLWWNHLLLVGITHELCLERPLHSDTFRMRIEM